MNEKNSKRSAEDVEIVLSKSLLAGVLLSAAIMLTGFVMFLVTGKSGYAGDVFPTNLVQIFMGAVSFKPYAIMLTGLFLLILTPVFRVGVSIIAFIKEKDYKFAKITALVFLILIISFFLGKAEQ